MSCHVWLKTESYTGKKSLLVGMVVVTKTNGSIRICIDPRDLNKVVKRQHFPLLTIEEVVSRMPNAKIFSKFDAT